MAVHFIYNSQGYLTGVYEGDGVPENSTTQQPIYTIGLTPQRVDGVWIDQAAMPILRPSDFFMLFLAAEEVAIRKLIADDPDSELAIWWTRLNSDLKEINLGLKSVQDGLTNLVAQGVLTKDRMDEILTGRAQ
jgi:hypothetical protein